MSNRLNGKIALITGSGGSHFKSESGLGFGGSSAFRFCQEGATVIVSDVNDKIGQKFTKELKEKRFDAYYHHLDVANEFQWKKTIDWIEKDFGRLDILVNNAGITSSSNIMETSESDWDKANNINSKGCFLGTKLVGILMKKNNSGSIINISSAYGIVASKASFAYHASKGSVISMSKAAAIQLAPHKVRVNTVCPGWSDTHFTMPLFDNPERVKAIVDTVPLGDWIPSDQIAWGVVYLASDESEWVTGTELIIDAGWTAQ